MDFTVKSDGNGVLLRSYLKRIRISGKIVSHLKAVPNGICVNGEHVTVRHVLSEGDVISLAIEDTEVNESITPVDLPIEILYEDADLIVCSKPPFMPTHPSCNHHDDTLANALAFYFEKQGQSFHWLKAYRNNCRRHTCTFCIFLQHIVQPLWKYQTQACLPTLKHLEQYLDRMPSPLQKDLRMESDKDAI